MRVSLEGAGFALRASMNGWAGLEAPRNGNFPRVKYRVLCGAAVTSSLELDGKQIVVGRVEVRCPLSHQPPRPVCARGDPRRASRVLSG